MVTRKAGMLFLFTRRPRVVIARNSPPTDDLRITMKKSEFLAKAWKLASAKARDLGWIV